MATKESELLALSCDCDNGDAAECKEGQSGACECACHSTSEGRASVEARAISYTSESELLARLDLTADEVGDMAHAVKLPGEYELKGERELLSNRRGVLSAIARLLDSTHSSLHWQFRNDAESYLLLKELADARALLAMVLR